MCNRVEPELEPELMPGFGETEEKSKPCRTLRAIVAERTCLNMIVEERREPAGTGIGGVIS